MGLGCVALYWGLCITSLWIGRARPPLIRSGTPGPSALGTWYKTLKRRTKTPVVCFLLLEETAGRLLMGFWKLLNRVKGKRRSIDVLKGHEVVVLVDDSTRMLRKGRWEEVRC